MKKELYLRKINDLFTYSGQDKIPILVAVMAVRATTGVLTRPRSAYGAGEFLGGDWGVRDWVWSGNNDIFSFHDYSMVIT